MYDAPKRKERKLSVLFPRTESSQVLAQILSCYQALCVANVRLLWLFCSMELASMLLLFQAAQDSSSQPPEMPQSSGRRWLQPLQAICH